MKQATLFFVACMAVLGVSPFGALQGANQSETRVVPTWSFSINPIALRMCYYDYFPCGPKSSPVERITYNGQDEYYLMYNEKHTATSNYFLHHVLLSNTGSYLNYGGPNAETTRPYNPALRYHEGDLKPAIAVMGYLYNPPNPSQPSDIYLTHDAFIGNLTNLINGFSLVVDNPVSQQNPNGSAVNSIFNDPLLLQCQSPLAGNRRTYVLGRYTDGSHNNLLRKPYISYTDWTEDMIEVGSNLSFQHYTIPLLENWFYDTNNLHEYQYDAIIGNSLFPDLFGYHRIKDLSGSRIYETTFDYVSYNPETGSQQYDSHDLSIETWNPPSAPGDRTGWFKDAENKTALLKWQVGDAQNSNLAKGAMGSLFYPGVWNLTASDGTEYKDFNCIKAAVYSPFDNSFKVVDIWPQKAPNDEVNESYCPWDTEAPYGVVDDWVAVNGITDLKMARDWNYPHWDDSAHNGYMTSLYNNVRMTDANSHGMMACVWQNSYKARKANVDNDPECADWENVPEIYISFSLDYGDHWSEPIVLNSINTPELANVKPMWVIPNHEIKYLSTSNDGKVGKLGLSFYDDYTWGSNFLSPPYHQTNDGGRIMFMELTVNIPYFTPPLLKRGVVHDPFPHAIVGPNPIPIYADIYVNGQAAEPRDILALLSYEDLGTDITCWGKVHPTVVNGISTCVLNVERHIGADNVYFIFWDYDLQHSWSFPISFEVWDIPYLSSMEDHLELIVGTYPTVFPPYPNLDSGSYEDSIPVELFCNTPHAIIHYTTDGSYPNLGSPIYSGSFEIRKDTTLRMFARKGGWTSSPRVQYNYDITGEIAGLQISPPSGSYQDSVSVTVSCATNWVTIRYTLDGSDPDENSNIMRVPFVLGNSAHFKARGFRDGWQPTPVSEAFYIFPSEVTEEFPSANAFMGLYPNPFSSYISAQIAVAREDTPVYLRVYNLKGQLVKTITQTILDRGNQILKWDGRDETNAHCGNGIYILNITIGKESYVCRAALVR